MKIYPCKHKIKSIPTSKIDTTLNIPLAYVDIDYTKYNISKIVDPKFSTHLKTILYPQQEFEDDNFILFNEFEEVVKKDNLFRKYNNKPTFYPANMIQFVPKFFLWKATVKKNLKYNISNNYDIQIGCKNNDTLNRNLISTFMNPSERNMLVYKNIKINSDDKTYSTFNEMTTEKADIMFIKSHNCKHYDVDNKKEIEINTFLDNHTNLWLGCEDAVSLNETYKMLVATTAHKFNIKSPIVSSSASIQTDHYFDLNTISVPAGVTIHNIFDTTLVPALILEYDNQGFIIITPYTLLDDPSSYEGFMYEIMMYVYCNTYVSTQYIKDWATYKMPNYEIINEAYTTKSSFTSKTSISTALGINGNYDLVNIEYKDVDDNRTLSPGTMASKNTGTIQCIGQNNGRPIFAIDGKLTGYTEPDKPVGWKSVYYNGKVYYIEKLYYLIEQNITDKITLLESEYDLIVKLYGFKSSSFNINKQADTTLKISFIKTDGELSQRIREAEYTIYYIKETSKINFCFAEDYKEDNTSIKLFNILVQQTDEAVDIYDMRQLGGGLSEDEFDNYELVDIGHINGRPYRVAGSLVLTMPAKYKPYESYIEKALNKYKTAEDYIAIFFEDEEDEDN